METLCTSKHEVQNHQKYVNNVFDKKLLLFHNIGSGKTLTALLTAKELLKKNKVDHVFVVTAASLVFNFKNEFSHSLLGFSNIPSQFTISSYQKFLKLNVPKRSFVIIDEVQNVLSIGGSLHKQFYEKLVIREPPNLHLMILSATPIVDKPHEIALALNLLNIPNKFNISQFYNDYLSDDNVFININDFKSRIFGFVSYFPGADSAAYATRKQKVVRCKMSPHQQNGYDTLFLDNSQLHSMSTHFLSGPRIAANIVYPSGRISRSILSDKFKHNLHQYSIKFSKCISNLKKNKQQAFVFSNFVAKGGTEDFVLALISKGYQKDSFGVFISGNEKHNKDIINKFNDGTIQIIIGSPAMKEGVSLKNCREVHLLEPSWNKSSTEQIIGRALRFCSHVSLPESQRNVTIFEYIATSSSVSVDQHIHNMSLKKHKVSSQFETATKEASIDCNLFHKNQCFRNNQTKVIKFKKLFKKKTFKKNQQTSTPLKQSKPFKPQDNHTLKFPRLSSIKSSVKSR